MADDLRTRVLNALDIERFYTEIGGLELGDGGVGQYLAFCPFHENTNTPALNIRTTDGVFHCFGCGVKGSVYDFYIRKLGLKGAEGAKFKKALHAIAEFAGVDVPKSGPELDDALVKEWHTALLKDPARVKWFWDKRGLTLDTLKKYKLGWDGERYTIPVWDAEGNLVNVRRYKPNAPAQYKMLGITGHNSMRIFNPHVFGKGKTIYLCEGELDCLLLLQHGFNATTVTSGVGNWDPVWTQLFAKEDVVLVYDNDAAGVKGTQKIGRLLLSVEATVRTVEWPEGFKTKGDVTDYIVEEHGDMAALLESAAIFVPSDAAPGTPAESGSGRFPLTDLGNAERFAAACGGDYRYIDAWGKWILWDEKKKPVWQVDDLKSALGRAFVVVRALKSEAEEVTDEKAQEAIRKWAINSESERRLNAIVQLAKPKLAVPLSELNSDPWMLNTPSGVVRLKKS